MRVEIDVKRLLEIKAIEPLKSLIALIKDFLPAPKGPKLSILHCGIFWKGELMSALYRAAYAPGRENPDGRK